MVGPSEKVAAVTEIRFGEEKGESVTMKRAILLPQKTDKWGRGDGMRDRKGRPLPAFPWKCQLSLRGRGLRPVVK